MVDGSEIETWVIDGAAAALVCLAEWRAVIRAGLVEAKIDEINGVIVVKCGPVCRAVPCPSHCSRATLPSFGAPQWAALQARQWRARAC